MAFSVYSLRISSDLPVQSDNTPRITWFFLTSVIINLFSMSWFIQLNYFKTSDYLPKFYEYMVDFLKRLICLLFHKCKSNAISVKLGSNNLSNRSQDTNDENGEKSVSSIKTGYTSKSCQFCKEEDNKNDKTMKSMLESKYKIINHMVLILITSCHIILQLIIFLS